MWSLRRWLRKIVYGLVIEEEEIKAAAAEWHTVQKCRYCQRPLLVECQFCPHCGTDLSERQTTAQQRLVKVLPTNGINPEYSPSATDIIAIAWNPETQRLKDVYNHLVRPLKEGRRGK